MPAKPGLIRYKANRAGVRKMLKSPEVQADLQRRANAVADVLRAELADEQDWEIISNVQVGRNRARALVSGVPMRIEVRERIMARAIGAAK